MIPAIGYTMCGADPRRLQTNASLNPCANAIEIDLDGGHLGLRCLRGLEFERVSLHAKPLAVAPTADSADHAPESALSRLTDLVRKCGAQAVSARLDSPATNSFAGAIPAPRAWKTESADLCRQVESVQTQLGSVSFYLESTVEAEWFTRNSHGKRVLRKVLAGTGCGWFLDVTAVYVEAMNSAQDACDFIEEMLPVADHVQLRLSGVFFDEKAERWVASDSHPIPEAVYELYAFVLEVAFDKVDAVFVKQDAAEADGFESNEIRTVREIAEGVSAIV
jgi:uncharacterized protein (UPF0276 family)